MWGCRGSIPLNRLQQNDFVEYDWSYLSTHQSIYFSTLVATCGNARSAFRASSDRAPQCCSKECPSTSGCLSTAWAFIKGPKHPLPATLPPFTGGRVGLRPKPGSSCYLSLVFVSWAVNQGLGEIVDGISSAAVPQGCALLPAAQRPRVVLNLVSFTILLFSFSFEVQSFNKSLSPYVSQNVSPFSQNQRV